MRTRTPARRPAGTDGHHGLLRVPRRSAVLLGGLGVAAVLMLVTPTAASAYWQTTDSSHPAAAVAGTMPAPTSFTASATSASAASLSWTAPANVTGYSLLQSPGTLAGCVSAPLASATSCSATGLSPATTYTWTLGALDSLWASTTVQAHAETPLGATSIGSSSFACNVVLLGATCNGPSITATSGTKLVVFAQVLASISLVSLGSPSISGPVTGVTPLNPLVSNGGGLLSYDNMYAWSATATGSGTVTISLSGVLVGTTVWLDVVQLGSGESALTCASGCTASGTGTAVTVQSSVTHPADSELVFLGSANGATFTAPSAFTTLAGGGSSSFGTYSQLVIQSTVSPGFTASSSPASWGSIAVEIDP
jgi:Fibronectin type III domain